MPSLAPSVHGLTILDLFCGAGGLSEGFRLAGFRTLGGTDIDPDAVATFALNFPDASAIYGDIRNRPLEKRVVELAAMPILSWGGRHARRFRKSGITRD